MADAYPSPIGDAITVYAVSADWADGWAIEEPYDSEHQAMDAARMCEEAGASEVRVELRVERIVPRIESVETIYGEEAG